MDKDGQSLNAASKHHFKDHSQCLQSDCSGPSESHRHCSAEPADTTTTRTKTKTPQEQQQQQEEEEEEQEQEKEQEPEPEPAAAAAALQVLAIIQKEQTLGHHPQRANEIQTQL